MTDSFYLQIDRKHAQSDVFITEVRLIQLKLYWTKEDEIFRRLWYHLYTTRFTCLEYLYRKLTLHVLKKPKHSVFINYFLALVFIELNSEQGDIACEKNKINGSDPRAHWTIVFEQKCIYHE